MHTLLDLRGNIPSFIHISDGKLRRSALECSCRKPEPSTSWIVATSTLPAFMCCTKPGPSSSRVPSRNDAHRGCDGSLDRHNEISLDGFYTRQDYPELLRASASRTPSPARRWSSSPTTSRFRPPPSGALQKPLAGGTLLQVDQAASSDRSSTARRRTRSKTQIWIAVSVYVLVAIVKKRLDLDASLYTLLQILSVTLFGPYIKHLRERKQMQRFANNQPIEFIRFLTLVKCRADFNSLHGLR